MSIIVSYGKIIVIKDLCLTLLVAVFALPYIFSSLIAQLLSYL